MWPKIQHMSHNNSGYSGSILIKLFQSTCRRAGVIMRVQFSEGPPPKICEGENTSEIPRNIWQLSTLIANIIGTDHQVESQKIPLSTTNPSTLGQKNWWTLVHKQKSYSVNIDLPEVLVHCKLTQVLAPRGSRILFRLRSHSPAAIAARGILNT